MGGFTRFAVISDGNDFAALIIIITQVFTRTKQSSSFTIASNRGWNRNVIFFFLINLHYLYGPNYALLSKLIL